MDDLIPEALAQVEEYPRLHQANERALVIAAMGLPYWIFRREARFVLCVEAAVLSRVKEELVLYEQERRANPFWRFYRSRRMSHSAAAGGGYSAQSAPSSAVPKGSFYFAFWLMTFFFLLQQAGPPWWTDAGDLSPEAVYGKGEWWRAGTALTLHGDLAHLGANLATGILFAYFLVPMFGAGLTWSAILLSGIAGNLLNALFYLGQPHVSIGSSTAVFGALGILVGAQLGRHARIEGLGRRRHWEIIVPLGAGAALLAYLGTGSQEHPVDFMAHFWGFICGIPLGGLGQWFRLRNRLGRGLQRLLGWGAILLPFACWAMALLARAQQ